MKQNYPDETNYLSIYLSQVPGSGRTFQVSRHSLKAETLTRLMHAHTIYHTLSLHVQRREDGIGRKGEGFVRKGGRWLGRSGMNIIREDGN